MSTKHNIYSPLHTIPSERQVFSYFDFIVFAASFGIGLAVIQAGSIVGLKLGLLSFPSIIMGSLIGSSLLALVGTIGARTGLSSMSCIKRIFGPYMFALPTFLNVLQLIGWGSFEIMIIRDSILFLSKDIFVGSTLFHSQTLWTILVGIIALLLAMSGPLNIVRVLMKKIGIWLVLTSCIWLTMNLVKLMIAGEHSLEPIKNPASFMFGADIVIAMAFSFLPVIGDYTRFAKTTRSSFTGILIGFCIANTWIMCLGAGYALFSTQASEMNMILFHLAQIGAGIPLIIILMNETDNIFIDIHSSAVSLGLITRKISVRTLSYFTGGICLLIALFVPLSYYEYFLIAIGCAFSPLFGVILAHWYFYKSNFMQPSAPHTIVLASLSWFIGIIIYQIAQYNNWVVGSSLSSLFVAGFTYLLCLVICAKFSLAQKK